MNPSPDALRRPRLFKATTWVLLLLCSMSMIFYIDRVNVATAGPALSKEFGFSATQYGFIFSVYAYPYFILQILGGMLGDRIGPRRTLAICSFIWSGATVLCGFATGFASLVIARLLIGIGEGAALPTSTRAMASWVEPRRRGFAQGITHACSRFGNAITPALVSWLIIRSGWRASFLVIGVASFAWTLAWFFYFRDDPREHPGVTPEEIALLDDHLESHHVPPVPWRALLPSMLPVAATYCCYGWVLWLFLSWLPTYLIHERHLDLKNSALFSSGIFLAGVLGDWLGGEVTDRLAKRPGGLKVARNRMVSACLVMTALSFLPIFAIPDMGTNTVALCMSAGFFFNELCIGPMWCCPMDIAPQYSGTASGIMNAGGAIAAILSPVVAGLIIDKTGNWNAPFLLAIGVTLTGAVLAFTMKPHEPLELAVVRPGPRNSG